MQELLKELHKKKHYYLFLIPAFIFLIVFNYYPAGNALYHSFFAWDGVSYEKFIGFENYINMLSDPALIQSTKNLFILWIGRLLTWTIFPLIAASLIFNLKSEKAQYFYRVIFLVPMVVPQIVRILLWQFMYSEHGPINQFLTVIGLEHLARGWLGSFEYALYAIIGVGFPWIVGLNFLIILAGLMNINQSVIEAAYVDGATTFRRFFAIDLPLIMGQIKLVIILTTINVIKGFQLILILTDGGPGYTTTVPGLVMYHNAFNYSMMGYACAVGTILFIVLFILTYINRRFIKTQ